MTCAICASDRGPFTREPLGRDDAMVNVCGGCSSPYMARGPSDFGYEPTGGLFKPGVVGQALRAKMGDEAYERESELLNEIARKPTPALGDDAFAIRDFRMDGAVRGSRARKTRVPR